MDESSRSNCASSAAAPSRRLSGFCRPPRRYLIAALAGIAAYLLLMRFTSGNRPEQLALCGLVLLLVLLCDWTRGFLTGMLPFFAFGASYDLLHIAGPLVAKYRLHVHVVEPYQFDRLVFGIPASGGILTPNELFALHHWPAVDFATGLAYILFVYWAIGFGIFLALKRGPEARRLLLHFGWTFFFLNIAGFATYYLYPAAPPWYVAQYGFGSVQYGAPASAAAALRWDALTGISYFASFYSRSANAFGAIPSLHVAYPLMVFIYGRAFRRLWLDALSFGFFLLVCFAAVYLQHHYVLDVLVGIAYALIAASVDRFLARGGAFTARRAPPPASCGTPL